MNVSKEAFERVRQALNKELGAAQSKLKMNRSHIRQFAQEQRTLKNEIGLLYKMIRDLQGKPAKVSKKHNCIPQ